MPVQGHFITSGNFSDCHNCKGGKGGGVCYWHQVGRGQECCQICYNSQDGPWPKMSTVEKLRRLRNPTQTLTLMITKLKRNSVRSRRILMRNLAPPCHQKGDSEGSTVFFILAFKRKDKAHHEAKSRDSGRSNK